MRSFSVAALVVVFVCGSNPAWAGNGPQPIRKTIAELPNSAFTSVDQARPNAPGADDGNRFFWPAVILMSAGGLVTLVGLTHDTGVACSTNSNVTSFSCGTTKSKAVIFTGLGMVGAGGFLFYKGRNQPQVAFGPRFIGVRQQLSW